MGRIVIPPTEQPVNIPSVNPAGVSVDNTVSTALGEVSKRFSDIAEIGAAKADQIAKEAPTTAMDTIIKQFETARKEFDAVGDVNEADVRKFNRDFLLTATKTAIRAGVRAKDLSKIQNATKNILIDTESRFISQKEGNAYITMDTGTGQSKVQYLDPQAQMASYAERAIGDLSPSQQFEFNKKRDTDPQGAQEIIGKAIAIKAQTDNNILTTSNIQSQSAMFTAQQERVKQALIPQNQSIINTLSTSLADQTDSIIKRLRTGEIDRATADDELNRLYEEQTIGNDDVAAYVQATSEDPRLFSQRLQPLKKSLQEAINLADPKTVLEYDEGVGELRLNLARQDWFNGLDEPTQKLLWSSESALNLITQMAVFEKTAQKDRGGISDVSMAFLYQKAYDNRIGYNKPVASFSQPMTTEELKVDGSGQQLVKKFATSFNSYLKGYANLTEADKEDIIIIQDLVKNYALFKSSPNYIKINESDRVLLEGGYNNLMGIISTEDPNGFKRLKNLEKKTIKPLKIR